MSDETKSVDWERLDLLEAKATKGPWFANDWSQDGGPNETTVESHSVEIVLEGQRGFWPQGIQCHKVAETNDGDKPLEDAAFIAQLRSEYPAIRAEIRAKDLTIYRLESEVTLLRLNAEVHGDLQRRNVDCLGRDGARGAEVGLRRN